MSELAVDRAADVPAAGSEVSAETAGGRLRAARVARELTLENVAEILRFSAHQIDALERNDYSRLPGTTLVRGMIRSYAKLLKISPEPLLAELDNKVPSNLTDVRPPNNIGAAATQTQVARVSRGVLYLVAAAIVVFCALAIFVNLASDINPAPIETAAVAPAVVAPATVVTTPAVTPAAMPPADSTPSPIDSSPIPPSGAVTESVPSVPDALVLEFDDLSWVEITDATQSIVLRGEYPKGTRQVVDGKAPFALWIGRASVVRVKYGERSIDLKANTRENVARLTVE